VTDTDRTITLARLDSLGPHPIDGPYVTDVWSGVIGPSGSMLLRRAHQLWQVHGDPVTVPAGDLANWLGLGMPSRVVDTAKRLAHFRLATWDGSTQTLRIRSHVGHVTPRQLERIGSIAQRIHHALTALEATA